MDRSERVGWD